MTLMPALLKFPVPSNLKTYEQGASLQANLTLITSSNLGTIKSSKSKKVNCLENRRERCDLIG